MKRTKKKKGGKWEISFSSIMRYNAVFCALVLLFVMLGGTAHSIWGMKSNAEVALSGSQSQISQRVAGAINLLEPLASLPEYYDPAIPPIDKVKKLDQLNPYFGYMMICFVDADIIVYSDGEESASLASRDYMQRLFSTGQTQVTDSFAAGADGTTLNYTVAAPLFDEQGDITGCLFCAIYFDEVVEILETSAGALDAEATLIGSRGQVMSSSAGLTYGDSVMDALRDDALFGTTADQLEEALLAARTGSYWNIRDGSLCYTAYQRVEQTNWDILCTVRFETLFFQMFPALLLTACLTALAALGLALYRQADGGR